MKRLFIDINVLLDVALERTPHLAASQNILIWIERKKAGGYFSALSCPILYYLICKEANHKIAVEYIQNLLKLLSVVEVNRKVLECAFKIQMPDYEDSIQIACAQVCSADYIITRDLKDYKKENYPAITPSEYLATFT